MSDSAVIEAVLFDWGGTLSVHADVDLLDTWRAAARVLAPDDPEPVAAALLAAEDRVVARVDRGRRPERDDRAARPLGRPRDAPRRRRCAAAYHDAWELTVEHDPAAVPVLTALKERGLRTGLLSNTHWPRELHERWLADAGLLELIDVRLYTSEMTHMKPHAEAFRALLDAVGVPPVRAVFVGDRLRDDVSGARAVGMRTVHLTGRPVEGWDVVPDAELATLDGLVELVDAWRRPATGHRAQGASGAGAAAPPPVGRPHRSRAGRRSRARTAPDRGCRHTR